MKTSKLDLKTTCLRKRVSVHNISSVVIAIFLFCIACEESPTEAEPLPSELIGVWKMESMDEKTYDSSNELVFDTSYTYAELLSHLDLAGYLIEFTQDSFIYHEATQTCFNRVSFPYTYDGATVSIGLSEIDMLKEGTAHFQGNNLVMTRYYDFSGHRCVCRTWVC